MTHSSSTRRRSVSMRILTGDQIWEIKQATFDVIEKLKFKCRHNQIWKLMETLLTNPGGTTP